MEELKRLVPQGHLLISHALTHSVALPDQVLETLSNADESVLSAQQAERVAYLRAFAEASKAIGGSVVDINVATARTARLRPLVDAALALLDFAAANAMPVTDETRNALVVTDAAVAAGTITPVQEQVFLKAYEKLTIALTPITADTLAASALRMPRVADIFLCVRKGVPLPRWTIGRFINALIFIVVLAGTGVSLAYYSVGATALTKYRELQASALDLKQQEGAANRDLAAKELALSPAAPKAAGQAASAASGQMEQTAAQNAVMQSKAALTAVHLQQDAVAAELSAVPERLGRWARQPCLSGNIIFNAALCAGVDAPDQVATTRGTLVDVEAARTVVSRMSDVYLPLLLGFLGAHAFILRRMSKEITAKTFAKGSSFNHIVRTGLGALAGLASTWLLTPEVVGGASFKAVPTWALAFVAGYGIELVFAFMDRIIAAFTSPAK